MPRSISNDVNLSEGAAAAAAVTGRQDISAQRRRNAVYRGVGRRNIERNAQAALKVRYLILPAYPAIDHPKPRSHADSHSDEIVSDVWTRVTLSRRRNRFRSRGNGTSRPGRVRDLPFSRSSRIFFADTREICERTHTPPSRRRADRFGARNAGDRRDDLGRVRGRLKIRRAARSSLSLSLSPPRPASTRFE